MFAPENIDPVVDFLVELAGDGQALELGIGTGRIALPLADAASPYTGSISPRRWSLGCEQSRAANRIDVTIGDFATTKVGRPVQARVRRLQHDPEPDDAGRTGRVLSERRRAAGARRLLRDRGRLAGPATPPVRRDDPSVRAQRATSRVRHVRRCQPGTGLAPLHAQRGRHVQVFLGARFATSGRRSST